MFWAGKLRMVDVDVGEMGKMVLQGSRDGEKNRTGKNAGESRIYRIIPESWGVPGTGGETPRGKMELTLWPTLYSTIEAQSPPQRGSHTIGTQQPLKSKHQPLENVSSSVWFRIGLTLAAERVMGIAAKHGPARKTKTLITLRTSMIPKPRRPPAGPSSPPRSRRASPPARPR